jgi:ubiquinone/menaquinone biosynthesis C-methylase UbiE
MNAPLEAKKFDLSQVDEAEHLIPRPYGTLQSLNLDHLYRYAFAKGHCYGAEVLDAAMGCGYSSLLLNCKRYTGVDIDPNMVAFANEVYLPMMGPQDPAAPKHRYLQGSVLELPVAAHSQDVYISFETIEHIQPGELPQYFAEVKRVLRPGGRFLCSTPIYRGDKYGLLTRYHPFEFRYMQFEATLASQGFVLDEVLYQWPPHFTLEHVVPSHAQTQQPAPFLTIVSARVPG